MMRKEQNEVHDETINHSSVQTDEVDAALSEEKNLQREEVVTDEKKKLQADDVKQISQEAYETLRLQQNFPKGLFAGILAGVAGAFLWCVITVITGYQIGYMALAIGAFVGFSIRYMGKGIDKKFGIAGAVIALLSCVLGNYLSIIGFLAHEGGLGYWETLTVINYEYFPELMAETFSVIDLLFYGIALVEGYKFSFRVITEKDIESLQRGTQYAQ